MLSYGIIAAVLSAIFFVFSQILARYASRFLGKIKAAVVVVGIGALPMAVYYLVYPVLLPPTIILYSAVAGIALAIGYILFYKTLETQQISNSSIVNLIQQALIGGFGILVLGESINIWNGLGIIGVVIGVLMIAETKGMKLNRKLLPAALGSASWGIYWLILITAINASGSLAGPLILARFVGFITVLAMFALTYKGTKQANRKVGILAILLLVCAGITDGVGNVAFGIGVQSHLVVLTSALSLMVPALVALMAWFVYKERLSTIQKAGLVLAIMGSVAIVLL